MQIVDGIPVWGEPLADAVRQMKTVREHGAVRVALMADHHVGYSQPIGGVCAYEQHVSPSGVGYDIACGNKAVRLDADVAEVRRRIASLMDEVWGTISFGIGRKNREEVDHELLHDDEAWDIPAVAALRDLARQQLGTVGSGNHYVDLFVDEVERVWVGVHFGSRGLGHKIAGRYIALAGGKDGMFVAPALLDAATDLGREYVMAMRLAGRYAYAGRDWVAARVAKILQTTILEEVHNHHNFAWREKHQIDGCDRDLWVVRKGATPAFPGQRGFVGATMTEPSVILEGRPGEESRLALFSTVHGAGRAMSRTRAAGKFRFRGGRLQQLSEGEISAQETRERVEQAGVELRGGGNDESPRAYKRLPEVLAAHGAAIRVVHTLRPIGVAMAGPGEFDPYRD